MKRYVCAAVGALAKPEECGLTKQHLNWLADFGFGDFRALRGYRSWKGAVIGPWELYSDDTAQALEALVERPGPSEDLRRELEHLVRGVPADLRDYVPSNDVGLSSDCAMVVLDILSGAVDPGSVVMDDLAFRVLHMAIANRNLPWAISDLIRGAQALHRLFGGADDLPGEWRQLLDDFRREATAAFMAVIRNWAYWTSSFGLDEENATVRRMATALRILHDRASSFEDAEQAIDLVFRMVANHHHTFVWGRQNLADLLKRSDRDLRLIESAVDVQLAVPTYIDRRLRQVAHTIQLACHLRSVRAQINRSHRLPSGIVRLYWRAMCRMRGLLWAVEAGAVAIHLVQETLRGLSPDSAHNLLRFAIQYDKDLMASWPREPYKSAEVAVARIVSGLRHRVDEDRVKVLHNVGSLLVSSGADIPADAADRITDSLCRSAGEIEIRDIRAVADVDMLRRQIQRGDYYISRYADSFDLLDLPHIVTFTTDTDALFGLIKLDLLLLRRHGVRLVYDCNTRLLQQVVDGSVRRQMRPVRMVRALQHQYGLRLQWIELLAQLLGEFEFAEPPTQLELYLGAAGAVAYERATSARVVSCMARPSGILAIYSSMKGLDRTHGVLLFSLHGRAVARVKLSLVVCVQCRRVLLHVDRPYNSQTRLSGHVSSIIRRLTEEYGAVKGTSCHCGGQLVKRLCATVLPYEDVFRRNRLRQVGDYVYLPGVEGLSEDQARLADQLYSQINEHICDRLHGLQLTVVRPEDARDALRRVLDRHEMDLDYPNIYVIGPTPPEVKVLGGSNDWSDVTEIGGQTNAAATDGDDFCVINEDDDPFSL